MGKKSAHTGESPKDRSINLMDKFITRSNNREKFQPRKPARRKDPNIPINLWPLKDQLEYWESRTAKDRFDEKYTSYGQWITAVQKKSGVYPTTFTDWVSPHKEFLKELFSKKTDVQSAVLELQKLGIY